MKCRYLSLSLFALLASLSMAFSITNGNSFAVSDLYYYIDDSTVDKTPYLCGSNTNYNCNDYHFIIIQTSGPSLGDYSNYGYYGVQSLDTGSLWLSVRNSVDYSFAAYFDAYTLRVVAYDVSSWLSDGGSVSITLTENSPFNCPDSPANSIFITQNGTYDVSSYAEAVVDVPPEIIQGDYHDDLQDLKQAAILIPAVLLLIYFFWAIYKMIMGGVRR